MKFFVCIAFLLLPFAILKAQTVRLVGIIDIYGLQTVSENKIRSALQIKEGDLLTKSTAEMEKMLLALPNVERVSVSRICCDDISHKNMLYVGIAEKGTKIFNYRAAPQGKIRLPAEISKTGEEFLKAIRQAVLKNEASEDDSHGHALFNNREARAIQLKFITLANRNLRLLHRVLRESSDAEARALATEIIAYHKDKRLVVDDLVYAADDADEAVRNNAMRALGIIARYALEQPAKKIKVPFQPFVRILNSLEWSDRNKSSLVIFGLTASRDAALLAALRREALLSLIEITRWKNPGHAVMSFFILGRIANLKEDEIGKLWESRNHEALIEKVKQAKSNLINKHQH